MKKHIQRLQKLLAIDRVLDNHPVLFEEKPQAQAVKDSFSDLVKRIATLISILTQPVSNVYGPKMQSEKNLRTQLRRMAGIGILVARRNNNDALLSQMKTYKNLATRATAFTMCEYAIFVANILQQYKSLAIELGLTEAEFTTFKKEAEDFGDMLRNTVFQLSDRRTSWKELRFLFTQASQLLKHEIDELVSYREYSDPDLFREYMTLRRSESRKGPAGNDDSLFFEITGTVTAANTGLPIEGATVEIAELNLTSETDEDGYYQLEDVPQGQYSINCHKTGFVTPEAQQLNTGADSSLVVDFLISPAESSKVTSAA
jgi:alkylhydroperoxidase/carboxymuconolactone decarboxylase family protein YurZ